MKSHPLILKKMPGLEQYRDDFSSIETGGDGLWRRGKDGVMAIFTPMDRKVEFILFDDKILAYVRSAMGHPAMYPLPDAVFEPPADAVLIDLDGTSVRSEEFWVWIIEQTTASLLGDPKFQLEQADMPHVSGHSVSEHLQYCIDKYCPGRQVEEARSRYFEIARREMLEIVSGRGRIDAFKPAPGLKDFLLTLKDRGVRLGLVTSGLYEKAYPEILSAFKQLGLGDPENFYDAIITAGYPLDRGQVGTLGELEPKPHPWLYAETARIGLRIAPENYHKVVGIEDSAAGVVAIRLAGFAAIGMSGGNIASGGLRPLLTAQFDELTETLPLILGE